MNIHWVLLPTDIFMWMVAVFLIYSTVYIYRNETLKSAWAFLWAQPSATFSGAILIFYFSIAFMDSIHFINMKQNHQVQSMLDYLLFPAGHNDEKSYSKPFSATLLNQETETSPDGKLYRIFPKLEHVKPINDGPLYILLKIIAQGMLFSSATLICYVLFRKVFSNYSFQIKHLVQLKSELFFVSTTCVLIFLTCLIMQFLPYDHIMGTDKVGQDIFYQAVKSVRTGMMIGTLTTLLMLPFAISLGMMAGYFGGFIDDIIQYIYTTLSSIPAVLLIAASVLSLQIFIENHPSWFPSMALRGDVRLLALCIILGLTSWTGLCRLIRAETLKLRELDFVLAAKTLGVSTIRILFRHILPNLFHLVLITIALDFSGLVLAEAVLSYVGVGVDPSLYSWGNMINSARMELARDPMVWWPLSAAFIFMFTLVLSANLFSDVLQRAFDPKKN